MQRKNCNEMLDEFDFFPKTRYWRPTERWERAWRRNLARAPRRRSPQGSQQIKDKVYEWREMPTRERPTLEELRKKFEPPVTKQYLSRLAHSLPPRTALPPIRHHSTFDSRPVPPSAILHVEPVIEGHTWDCQCGGCCAARRIQAAMRG